MCQDLSRITLVINDSDELDTRTLSVLPEPAGYLRQAETDQQLIELWLHGRSNETQRAYRSDVKLLQSFVNVPLNQMRLEDLQVFADNLQDQGLKLSSIHRRLAAVKSMFSFGHKLGYLVFDTARALRLPALRNELSERILDEDQVHQIINLEPNPRNQLILKFLYATGVRVSELCGLQWKHFQRRRTGGGQVTVFGKGGKTRTILLPQSIWRYFDEPFTGQPESPVFVSRKKGFLQADQVRRIVRKAAKRAGINLKVSPHWMRHAHASHSLERQAQIHLVQKTLGHSSIATTGRYLHARPTESSSSYLEL
jgi:integrase/recombinase XerD